MDSKEVFMSMWNLIWSKLIEFGSNEQSADHLKRTISEVNSGRQEWGH